MHAIRHYIFLVAALTALGFVAGPRETLWVAVTVVGSIGVKGMDRVIARRGYASQLMLVFIFGSLVLVVGGAVLLFLRFGWLVGVSTIVIFVGYFTVMESSLSKEKRAVASVRAVLLSYVTEWMAGDIAEAQLQVRSFKILREDLPEGAYSSRWLVDVLLSTRGLSSDQHQRLLRVLDQYLSTLDRGYLPYELQTAVRAGLGSSQTP